MTGLLFVMQWSFNGPACLWSFRRGLHPRRPVTSSTVKWGCRARVMP